MSNFPLPSVGTEGYYSVKPPFDQVLDTARIYTTTAVRSIQDLSTDNVRPLESIYLPIGLTEEDFKKDIDDNVKIVVLTADDGEKVYIPNRYLNSLPITSGVEYQGKVISINLGPLPVSQPLDPVKDLLHDMVYDTLGIDPDLDIIETSSVVMVNDETHNKLTTIRSQNVSVKKSWRTRYEEALTRIKALEKHIAGLECYIVSGGCNINCGNPHEDDVLYFGCGCPDDIGHSPVEYFFLEEYVAIPHLKVSKGSRGSIFVYPDDDANGSASRVIESCNDPCSMLMTGTPDSLFLIDS